MTLLAAYNFDEASGSVIDVTGNGHDFALSGNTVRTVSGHTSQGLTQNSSSIDVGPSPFGLTPNRTIMMWIKSAASVTDGRVFETVASSDGNSIWEFPLLRDSSWHLQAWNASTFGRATLTRPTDGNWHHIAGTYDGTNLRAYKDGVLSATTAFSGPLRADGSGTTLNIFHTAPSHIIDDLRVYDEALDATAITALMSQPVTAGGPADVPGTVSAVLGGLTAAATATRQVAASGTSTLPGLSSSTVATVGKAGTGSAVLGGVTAVVTARRTTGGSAAVTLPGLLASAAGTVTAPDHPHGTVMLPAPTVVAVGRRTTAGAASVQLGQIIVTARVPVPSGDLGPWLTLGDLMEARATHELIMIDTIGVRHPGMTEGAFDPDLGYAPATPQPEYYHGKATVQARQISSGLVNPAGLGTLTQLGYAVHGPVGSAIDNAAPDDVITVYDSADPRHTGLKLVVRNVESSSFATARRLVCTLYEVSTP